MADNSDTPKILEEISRAGAKGKGRPRNQKNARRRLFAVALLLVPILVTTCYLGFEFYELRKEFATLNSRYGSLSSNVSDQNSQFQALATEVDQFSSAEIPGQSLIENIRMMNSEIEALKARGLDRPSEPDSYWHIREAEFLLNLANRKLTLEKDINSSIALIEDADSSIVASGHQNAIPLRESLSQALVNLRAFVEVDKEGIFIQIESIKPIVEGIEVKRLKNPNNAISEASTEFEDMEYSNLSLNSIVSFLSNIFVWREWENPSDVILISHQRAIAKQRLHLLLEQAQHGLVSQNGIVYKQSLIGFKDLFSMLVTRQSAAGEAIMVELDDLAAINIEPEMPSLTEPLQLMNQLKSRLQN